MTAALSLISFGSCVKMHFTGQASSSSCAPIRCDKFASNSWLKNSVQKRIFCGGLSETSCSELYGVPCVATYFDEFVSLSGRSHCTASMSSENPKMHWKIVFKSALSMGFMAKFKFKFKFTMNGQNWAALYRLLHQHLKLVHSRCVWRRPVTQIIVINNFSYHVDKENKYLLCRCSKKYPEAIQ